MVCLLCYVSVVCFFFKQKTAYEMRISDWSSDVCSSDRIEQNTHGLAMASEARCVLRWTAKVKGAARRAGRGAALHAFLPVTAVGGGHAAAIVRFLHMLWGFCTITARCRDAIWIRSGRSSRSLRNPWDELAFRSEEHTSE